MQTKEERAIVQKQYYKDNKEKLKAQQKKYREDNKEYFKQYRKDNSEKTKARGKLYYKNNREEKMVIRYERRFKLFKYKGGECAHCKLSEPDQLEIYDYHHVDPSTKLHPICQIMHGPIERLIAEVDKCLLLCSNCHRKEHARLHKEATYEAI